MSSLRHRNEHLGQHARAHHQEGTPHAAEVVKTHGRPVAQRKLVDGPVHTKDSEANAHLHHLLREERNVLIPHLGRNVLFPHLGRRAATRIRVWPFGVVANTRKRKGKSTLAIPLLWQGWFPDVKAQGALCSMMLQTLAKMQTQTGNAVTSTEAKSTSTKLTEACVARIPSGSR